MSRDEMIEVMCAGYWPTHWPHAFGDEDAASIRRHMGNALDALEALGYRPVRFIQSTRDHLVIKEDR